MKNKFTILLSFVLIITLTGCDKYEKDISLNTELYGSYSKITEATNVSYSNNINYTFYENNEYNYSRKEVIEETITQDVNKNGKILSIEEISDDITKIILDQKFVEFGLDEAYNKSVYKYKNMLGNFYECTFPEGKTFNLKSDDFDFWFDEEGQYHLCIDTTECDCITNCPQYIRKDNIIYFQSMSEEHKNTYSIGAYIVEGGVFFPELYKSIEN